MISQCFLTRDETGELVGKQTRHPELVENYEAALNDTKVLWICHHRDEIDLGLSKDELVARGMYYYCHPSKLIFLPYKVHGATHFYGRWLTRQEWNRYYIKHFVTFTTWRKLCQNPSFGSDADVEQITGKKHPLSQL